jgi:SAM-dependent methyltransferase
MSLKPREKPKFTTLEKGQRLSNSILWKWQRDFFERQGIDAWRANIVPHHITSSAFIANAYARILLGFLRGCKLNRRHPLYILELGAGSGRLAWLILKNLGQYADHPVLKDVALKYVMTDISRLTLDYWQSHPGLRDFMEKGLLDIAHFDPLGDTAIQLLVSGKTIVPDNLANPLIVIANYVFDGIPQDAFHARGGYLFEGLVTTRCPRSAADPDGAQLENANIAYHYHPAPAPYYDEPEWNQILREYTERLPDTKFLFPVAALRAIAGLERLSGGRLLLLSADRGYTGEESLHMGKGAPDMSHHGSVSMMVDYQILGEYFRLRGGEVLHPARRAASLNVSLFLTASLAAAHTETRLAWEDAIDRFGPDDFFTLKEGLDRCYEALSAEQLLSVLRLSCWDYRRFLAMAPRLIELAATFSPAQREELSDAVARVWDAYLPLGESNDLAVTIGTLLVQMQYHEEGSKFLSGT